jgi:ADP-ribosyl-[dinitrogen reductase] hydrolase
MTSGMRDVATPLDRATGCLLGLAVGDALGTTVEFRRRGSFEPVGDIVGGGPFGLKPGQWTDDTSMALCLADSLIECGAFDPADQMRRYVRWWRDGYRSSTGVCFDIGGTTRRALREFERSGNPVAGSTESTAAGNGSLMRLAPIPIRYQNDPRETVIRAAQSSQTTHAATEAVDACRYFAGLVAGALRGASKDELTSARFMPESVDWNQHPLCPGVERIAAGSFRHAEAARISATGYVLHTLEAALWAFWGSSSFEQGALMAVNLGDDADTTGAVYGQLAGAFYGRSGLPSRWLDVLHLQQDIEGVAARLHQTGLH